MPVLAHLPSLAGLAVENTGIVDQNVEADIVAQDRICKPPDFRDG